MTKRIPITISIVLTISICLGLLYKTNNLKSHGRKNIRKTRKTQQIVINPNDFKLPLFSSNILQGYTSCNIELQRDIQKAAMYLAKEMITNNIKEGMTTGPRPIMMYAIAESSMTAAAPVPSPNSAGGAKMDSSIVEDSYGTNNQVQGVDEADITKSDGTNMYIVYGKEVIVMTLDGSVLSRTTVPKLNQNVIPDIDFWGIDSYDKYNNNGWNSMMPPPYYFQEEITVQGLLFDSKNRLVVIATAYSKTAPKTIGSEITVAYIYEISTLDAKLTLVDTKMMRGSYKNARSIQSKAYIATNTYIDIYETLGNELDRYNEFYWFMEDDQYEFFAMQKLLNEELLAKFSQQLMVELLGDNDGFIDENACRNIVQLSLMQSSSATDSNDEDSEEHHAVDLLRGFAQVASFDMQSTLTYSTNRISGVFLPSADLDLYASNNVLFFGARGYDKETSSTSSRVFWNEYTYLVGFDLINGIAVPSSTGKVVGYILNQFSMDYYNNNLRIATTTNEKWGRISDEDSKDVKWGAIAPSTNQVFILEKQGNLLQTVGQIMDLGTTESIYSVRFMQQRGFVVTFRRTDPLYALDLSIPTQPKSLGELKITGFSNYLHPVSDRYLIGVGQEADEETGRTLGLLISLFDVGDMTNPILLHKAVIEGKSYSDAQYDHHAFRYLPESQILILPVSVYPKNYKNNQDLFDGFFTYYIDPDAGILKVGEVVHADENLVSFYQCFSSAYLSPRSMVFSSNLITFKGHTVINSGNLFDMNQQWLMNLDAGRSTSCTDWFPWF